MAGDDRNPRPHIWIASLRLLRSGRTSHTQPTSTQSNPFASALTLSNTRSAESGFRYSPSSAARSTSLVSDVKHAAITPAALNCLAISSQCAIVAPKTIVLRSLANFFHSLTTSPMISMPRSDAALSVHSPPAVAAPRISTLVQEKTRIGTSTPDSVSACMLDAQTRLLKILPRPSENGVADSPITCAEQSLILLTHTDICTCASSITIRSTSGHLRRASV